MKIISIEKISEDYGGDNLLFKIHLDEEKINVENIEDELFYINRSQKYDFQWNCYISYDNMDYNGIFFETIYIDKDNLSHKIENGKIIITDKFICDLILGDLEELLNEINNNGEFELEE